MQSFRSRAWVPVAPVWERKPEDKEIWRRAVTMPALALNQAERDLLGTVGGREVAVLGVGDGIAPLALAALGARVLVIDPSHSLLDLVVVRTQLAGVAIQTLVAELSDLSPVPDSGFDLCYAAQAGTQVCDLERLYSDVHRLLRAGGRLVVNEYHPTRRIWRKEPGSPRLARSYFERRIECDEAAENSPANPSPGLGRYEYHWTVSDHVYSIIRAGLRLAAMEEVGEVRQHWEIPNLRGLPEQLIIAADKPGP